MEAAPAPVDHGRTLLARYDESLPEVFGYLLARCRDRMIAEDLTSDTYMAAVDSIRRDQVHSVTTAWLVGIARHKLVDHWRRVEREDRRLIAVASDPELSSSEDDPWDGQLDVLLARDVLASLGAHHRAALTLRYVDDLPVAAVAETIGRTEQATEALLVRARQAFRSAYEGMQ